MSSKRETKLIFPPNFDEDETWNMNIERLRKGHTERNWYDIVASLRFFDEVGKWRVVPFTSERMKGLIPVLVGFIIDRECLTHVEQQTWACRVFCDMMQRTGHAKPPEVKVPFDEVYKFYKKVLKLKWMEVGDAIGRIEDYFRFLRELRVFYSEEDGQKILEMHRDRIGTTDTNSWGPFKEMMLFLPPSVLPDVVDDLMIILEDFVNDSMVEEVLDYFERAMKNYPYCGKKFNWTPYLDGLFRAIMINLRPSIEIAGKEREMATDLRTAYTMAFYTGYASELSQSESGVAARLLIAGEQGDCALDRLEMLLKLLEPMISPGSKNTFELCSFVAGLVTNAEQEFKKEATIKKKHKELEFQYMTERQRNRFGQMIVPVLKSILTKAHYKEALEEVMNACEIMTCMCYDIMYKELFLFAVGNMVDPENGSMSKTCNRVIKAMIPFVFEQDHIRGNIMYIPKIFEATVPNLRSPGTKIHTEAFSMIHNLCGLLYVDEDIDKLGMKERMIAHTLFSIFDEIIAAAVNKGSVDAQVNDEEHEQNRTCAALDDAFFAAYSTSFIESKLSSIMAKMAESHPRSMAYTNLTMIIMSHSSLLRKMTELVIQRYRGAQTSMKGFWASAISSVAAPCPQLIDVLPMLFEVVKEMIAEEEKGNIKRANAILHALSSISVQASCQDNRCAPLDDDVTSMWGRTFTTKEMDPRLFELSDDEAAEIARRTLEVYRPLLDRFHTFGLKEQTQISSIFAVFGKLFMRRGDIRTCRARKMNSGLESVMETVLDYAKQIIQSTTNSAIKKSLIEAASLLPGDCPVSPAQRRQRIIKFTKEGRKVMFSRSMEWPWFIKKQRLINLIMVPEHSDRMSEFISTTIIPEVFSEYGPVRQAATALLYRDLVHHWPGVFDALINRCCDIIEGEKKTEGMLCGALMMTKNSVHEVTTDSNLLTRFIMALVKTEYDKEWQVDDLLFETLNPLARRRIFIPWVSSLASTFAKLQVDVMSVEKGALTEHAYRFVMLFLATGPAPFTLDVFQFFWNALLSPEAGRKNRSVHEVYLLLNRMEPRRQTVILDHFPEDCYIVDNACTGFSREPKHVKVATGPATFPAEYAYVEVREWLVSNFTRETVEQLIRSLSTSKSVDRKETSKINMDLWAALCRIIGPSIIDVLEPIAQREDDDLELLITFSEMTTGVAIGSRVWSFEDNQAALARITAVFMARMLNRKQAEIFDDLIATLHMVCGDADYRRNGWVIDICKALAGRSGDENALKSAMAVFEMLSEETHLCFHGDLNKVIMESIIPRMRPLSASSQQNSEGFAHMLRAALISGTTPLEKYKFDNIAVIFEQVFDQEYGKANDNLAIFLGSLDFESNYGAHRALPYIAERVTRIFELRNNVTIIGVPAIESFLIGLGCLPWFRRPDQLDRVISDLINLYPTSAWFVRQSIIHFVHTLCFYNMLMLKSDVYERFFKEMLPLFVQDEKNELRESAVLVVRMLIPVHFCNFETFYNKAIIEEKNPKIAAAYTVALIGAITVIDESPEWLPSLFALAESAHKKVPFYSKMIENEFSDFWKRAGQHEIAAIEDFRYTFSGGYFC